MKTAGKSCVYCGHPATETEHVVGKCLLIDKGQPVTVPSCSDCNKEKGLDDEYLRDMFVIRIETADVSELTPHREKAHRSATRQGVLPPIQKMVSTLLPLGMVTTSGDLQLTRKAVVEARTERIRSGLWWIVRGLWSRHTKTPLDKDLPYDVWSYYEGDNKSRFDRIWPSKGYNGPYSVGGCLVYKVMIVEEVPNFSNWLLAFYDRLFFIVSVREDQLGSACQSIKSA